MSITLVSLFMHLLGVIVWVGGMAFAYVCLRPAAMQLEPPQRLRLWQGVLARFFPLVWISIGLILLSGFGTLGGVGFATAPTAWHLMMLTGLTMVAVFSNLWLGPWARLKRAIAAQDWPAGAAALAGIRKRVAFNLGLGVLTVAIATMGLALN